MSGFGAKRTYMVVWARPLRSRMTHNGPQAPRNPGVRQVSRTREVWYLPVGSTEDVAIEKARLHRAARRGGGMAACARGARAAASEGADHWVPWTGNAFGLECMDRRLCSATARTRLDRGSHPGDRVSLGGGKSRALRRDCR